MNRLLTFTTAPTGGASGVATMVHVAVFQPVPVAFVANKPTTFVTTSLGVPLMTPLPVFKESPPGKLVTP